ncbi:MAG: ribosome recycling factor [Negativicutes bacterium]|jgi:ribosome recycling factor
MMKDVLSNHEERMKKTIEVLKKEYANMRAGRANPHLLDKIMVDYYGTPTALNQVANITVPEARLLTIQPWEKTMTSVIEKAILKSDLGINPSSDGAIIRIAFPQLTKERRQELVKDVHKKAETDKIAIRNLRRDGNEQIKKIEKDKSITEDESKKAQEDMQKLTDKYIKEIDNIAVAKEKELMEV